MINDNLNFEKFSRQMMLPFIGTQGQEKLRNSHIVVVGCGGLGCPLLLYLAASGVGTITIIDNDTVSTSNLHRQILFNHHDIGQSKSMIAAQKIMSMHPDTKIIPVIKRLDTSLAHNVCITADLVIDSTDSFISKYILSDICGTLLMASVVGIKGYVAGFTKDIPYRDIFPTIPNNAPNCSQTGVLGSVAGLIGTVLATEAIKIILNHENHIMGKMIHIDMNKLRFNTVKLHSDCDKKDFKLPMFEYITAQEIVNGTVIDVRETDELIDNPLIENSVSMPLSTLNMNDLMMIKNPIFKCHTGRRAERVALRLGLLTQTMPKIGIMIQ
jgi:adenylyltransferase/sulfurtransferase